MPVSATVFFESASELATLTNTFSVSGTPTDPTTISLAITDPHSATTTYTYAGGTITRTGTGVYTKDIPCSTAGTWQYVWTGTGSASDVTVGTWEVHSASVGKLYATVEALKSRLGITDTVDDLEIHGACLAASQSLEQHCDRIFWRTAAATVRTFAARDYYCLKLPAFNDVVSVSELATDSSGDGTFETSWASTDYQLLPFNTAGPETRPYTEIRAIAGRSFPVCSYAGSGREDRVQVTGVFGWPSVPYAIRQAALIMAADYLKLKDAPFGVAGFGEFGPVRVQSNRAAAALAAPYRRNPILVG